MMSYQPPITPEQYAERMNSLLMHAIMEGSVFPHPDPTQTSNMVYLMANPLADVLADMIGMFCATGELYASKTSQRELADRMRRRIIERTPAMREVFSRGLSHIPLADLGAKSRGGC
jgi:hypothetical protein